MQHLSNDWQKRIKIYQIKGLTGLRKDQKIRFHASVLILKKDPEKIV